MAVIVCPICGARYKVADEKLAKATRLRCKKCNTVFPASENIKPPAAPQPTPEASESPESHLPSSAEAQADMNLSDLSLDFGASAESSSESLDFSFDTSGASEEIVSTRAEAEEEQQALSEGPGDLSFADGGAADNEAGMPEDESLDFSFSAAVPEDIPEEDEEEDFEESEELAGDEEGESLGLEGLNLGGALESEEDEASMDLSGLQQEPEAAEEEEAAEDYTGPAAEPLKTCCIDSLAMGLTTCELCGTNLEGREHEVDEAFMQQRRQELKESLLAGDAAIGFSTEQGENGADSLQTAEDFSDVEQALDALADGSFEKQIKKKETYTTLAQKMKMLGAGVVVLLVILGAAAWFLLPSSHEKLMNRYTDLMAQDTPAPRDVAALFLDTVAARDREVFQRISVMAEMPSIANGKISSMGAEEGPVAVGTLGQDIEQLQQEIADLEQQIETKTKTLQEYSSKQLSPGLIEEAIKRLQEKEETLVQEFEAKINESKTRLVRLQNQLARAQEELAENQQKARKYMDATDPQGKAVYLASVRKQQSLEEEIVELGRRIAEEQQEHDQRAQALSAEYEPQLEGLRGEIQHQQALYEEAILLKDKEKSPVTQLSEELDQMTQTIIDKKDLLKTKRQQLAAAVGFFKRQEHQKWLDQVKNQAAFTYSTRNVIASAKYNGRKQKILLVLKRYQATVEDKTLQSDWLVEKVLT